MCVSFLSVCMCLCVCVCVCGPLVNDHHISIQNLIACLRSTLKETQHHQQKEAAGSKWECRRAGQEKQKKHFIQRKTRFRGCSSSVSCHSTVGNDHRAAPHNITAQFGDINLIPFQIKLQHKKNWESVNLFQSASQRVPEPFGFHFFPRSLI